MNSLGWKTNLLQLFRPLPAGSLEFITSDVDLFLRGWRVLNLTFSSLEFVTSEVEFFIRGWIALLSLSFRLEEAAANLI